MHRLLSSFILSGWLWALALAASPQLHEWAHPDCGDHDHDCLATQLWHGTTGHESAEPPRVTAPAGWTDFHPPLPAEIALSSLAVEGAAWAHGPPPPSRRTTA